MKPIARLVVRPDGEAQSRLIRSQIGIWLQQHLRALEIQIWNQYRGIWGGYPPNLFSPPAAEQRQEPR